MAEFLKTEYQKLKAKYYKRHCEIMAKVKAGELTLLKFDPVNNYMWTSDELQELKGMREQLKGLRKLGYYAEFGNTDWAKVPSKPQ